MTAAHHPHPLAPPWAALVTGAFVASSLLTLVDWSPVAVAEAAPARMSDGSPAQTDISQLFYEEKTMAPASELPAQF